MSEKYGVVIDNISKKLISSRLKNSELSGDPTTGSIEATRLANLESNVYGTARSGGAGQKGKVKPVTVSIDVDRELIEEVEDKDVRLLGVDGYIGKKTVSHQGSMERELERAFFAELCKGGTRKTSFTGSTELEKFDEIVRCVTSVANDYVDGVDKALVHVTLSETKYDALREYIDTTTRNSAITGEKEKINVLHGVQVESSLYLPTGVDYAVQAIGSIAQPVMPTIDELAKFPASNAYHFGLFYSYGTKCVMPDLIFYVGSALDNLTASCADSSTSGATDLTVTAFTGASTYKYKVIGATADTAPSYGDEVTGYTAITAGTATAISTTNDYYIDVVALDDSGKVIAGKQVKAVIS